MARTRDQIRASLASLYDPQLALLREQGALLPGQEQAAVQGLESAKTNAFSDITAAANARGMVYSGAPMDEQNRYVGEKYLPALAGLRADFAGQRSKLQQGLLGIEADRARDTESIYNDEVRADQEAAYKQQQLALERQKLAQRPAKQPSAADKATAVRASLNQDLAAAFKDFGKQGRFFTEQQVIPRLLAAYPEVDQQQLIKTVYAYRKGLGYG